MFFPGLKSLPSRERGLKYLLTLSIDGLSIVAPLAGAWIEINPAVSVRCSSAVAPLAGAWIEMI